MNPTFTQFYRTPYLKFQWLFPNGDVKELSSQMDKAYIDIALKVNDRIIGIFPQNLMVVTGERWSLNGYTGNLQTLRKVFVFGPIAPGTTSSLPTGINSLISFTRIYGVGAVTDGTTWIPLPYAPNAVVTDGIELRVENIGGVQNVTIDSGATAYSLSSAIVVLEWLSAV